MKTIECRQWLSRGTCAVGLALVGVALAACGSSPGGSTAQSTGTPSTTASAAGATGAKVDSTSSTKYGSILVNSSGDTLYMLTADSSSNSVCGASCITLWPPLTTTGRPGAGSGVKASLLGTISRSDGSKQVTYDGHPLYTFSGDSSAGQTNGQKIASFGGTWYVLDTSGRPVTGSSTTQTTSGSSGYRY